MVPIIPPLLENYMPVLDFLLQHKSHIFSDYFVHQCITLGSANEIPTVFKLNVPLVADFHVSDAKYIKQNSITQFQRGSWLGEMSGYMIKYAITLTLVVPLKLIFEALLVHGIFPEIWK